MTKTYREFAYLIEDFPQFLKPENSPNIIDDIINKLESGELESSGEDVHQYIRRAEDGKTVKEIGSGFFFYGLVWSKRKREKGRNKAF